MGLPEASDPVGFLGDVELRPYQRQALHWMLNRERGDDSREDLGKGTNALVGAVAKSGTSVFDDRARD